MAQSPAGSRELGLANPDNIQKVRRQALTDPSSAVAAP